MAAALCASLALRAAVFLEDPGCMRLQCVGHPRSVFFSGDNEGELQNALKAGAWPGDDYSACQFCSLKNSAWAELYVPSMYTPTHTRLAPFFVGALSCIYHQTQVQKSSTRRVEWPLLRSVLLVLSVLWVLERHSVLALMSVPPLAGRLPVPIVEIFGGTIDAAAWAILTLSSILPKSHWLQSDFLKNIGSLNIFKLPSRLSFGIYCFHWPILMSLVRFTPRNLLPYNAYLAFLIPFLLVVILSGVAAQVVDRHVLSPVDQAARSLLNSAFRSHA